MSLSNTKESKLTQKHFYNATLDFADRHIRPEIHF